MSLVKIRGLRKSYQMGSSKVCALAGVDLDIAQGDYIAIMGPSGSGKSTLLHLLGCLDQPSEGKYWLNGQDVSSLDDSELSRVRGSQIGFVFQAFHLIPQLTVRQNVTLPYVYQGQESPRAEEALERVGLAHRLDHKPTELSGGEMQRVAIARALAVDPAIILADEPTGNLDSKTGRSILDLFQELHREGVTIVVVTHDPKVASECGRLVEMADARIVRECQQ